MDKQIDIKHTGIFRFDEHVKHVMDEWNVHGTAIAVIKDGEVIHSRGYGWRDFDRKLPVNSQTLFAIGSASKAFTAAALGILVDRGLLEWDRPVCKYLPDFHLMDPFCNERITPHDPACHRSGLPGHNMMWFGSPATAKNLLNGWRMCSPTRIFEHFPISEYDVCRCRYLVEVLHRSDMGSRLLNRNFRQAGDALQ